MKPVLRYVFDFFKKDCPPVYFFCITVFVTLLIYLNYGQHLESKYLLPLKGIEKFLSYFLLFFLVYVGSVFLQRWFYTDRIQWNRKIFLLILLAPAFFAFRIAFSLQEPLVREYASPERVRFYLQTIGWVVRAIVVLIPVYIFWRIYDAKKQPFYGTSRIDSFRPYLMLLACVVPILLLSFLDHHIHAYYPRVKTVFQLPSTTPLDYIFFESSYGFDFLSIELFFRGFLILGLATELGPRCILPMAAFYCSIHFGKPLPECVSSFFGGILLGTIAYRTKSVWGGLFLHLGIAWIMEILGTVFH